MRWRGAFGCGGRLGSLFVKRLEYSFMKRALSSVASDGDIVGSSLSAGFIEGCFICTNGRETSLRSLGGRIFLDPSLLSIISSPSPWVLIALHSAEFGRRMSLAAGSILILSAARNGMPNIIS